MTTAHRVMPCRSRLCRDALALCATFTVLLAAPSSRAQGANGAGDDVDPPAVTHDEVKSGRVGVPVVVRATIADPSGVFDPAVLYRVGGEGEFLRLSMEGGEGGGAYEAVIPGEVVSDDLEYFIEAFDQRGNGPARYADADLPVKVPVLTTAEPIAPPTGTGAVGEEEGDGGGALWITAGVVGAGLLLAAAAAAGVAAFVLLSPPAVPAQVDVVVSAPTPVAAGISP